jgi:predicted transcriptional regulator
MSKPLTPLSIRLDAETEQRLRRLAHESGGTLSAVVREAVAEYGAARETGLQTARPNDRLAHLTGVVHSRADRSERTGEQFRSALKAKSRARRPR